MRKLVATAVFSLFFALFAAMSVYAADIRVMIDHGLAGSRQVEFADQQPVVINGRTLVPVRGLFEALGYEVGWYPGEGQDGRDVVVLSYRGGGPGYPFREYIQITLGYPSIISQTTMMDQAFDNYVFTSVFPQTINGRVMLPVRYILDASMFFDFEWNEAERTIEIWSTIAG